jgi:hypothetical protein
MSEAKAKRGAIEAPGAVGEEPRERSSRPAFEGQKK